MKRNFNVLIVLIVILFTIPSSAVFAEDLATDTSNPQTRYSHITAHSASLQISSSGLASFESRVYCAGDYDIRINGYLQRYINGSWSNVKSVTTIENSEKVVLASQWYVSSGYQYRFMTYVYVYDNGTLVESTSRASNTVTY